MKKMNFKARSTQSGFTLIELIVVIVILGIMAATALPKFIDMGVDARVAKMQAAAGAMKAAAAMGYAQTAASGGTPTYPAATAIEALAGLNNGDYDLSGADGVVASDSDHPTCAITYVAATGTVTGADTATLTTACGGSTGT